MSAFLQPGLGLGFSGGKEIAFGLGTIWGRRLTYYGGRREYDEFMLRQRILKDDDEIVEMLAAIVPYIN